MFQKLQVLIIIIDKQNKTHQFLLAVLHDEDDYAIMLMSRY